MRCPVVRGALGTTASDVILADNSGVVYALAARSGRTDWTFETGDAVQGGVTVAKGVVYVASADETLYALDADTGALETERGEVSAILPPE